MRDIFKATAIIDIEYDNRNEETPHVIFEIKPSDLAVLIEALNDANRELIRIERLENKLAAIIGGNGDAE